LKIVGDVAEGSVFLRSFSRHTDQTYHSGSTKEATTSTRMPISAFGWTNREDVSSTIKDPNNARISPHMRKQRRSMAINAPLWNQMEQEEPETRRNVFSI